MILLRVFVNDFTPIKIRRSWKHRYIVNFNFAAISGINRCAGKSGGRSSVSIYFAHNRVSSRERSDINRFDVSRSFNRGTVLIFAGKETILRRKSSLSPVRECV